MNRAPSRPLPALLLTVTAGLLAALCPPEVRGSEDDRPTPRWIWSVAAVEDGKGAYFRKDFEVPGAVATAKLVVTCDNDAEVFLDGKHVAGCREWETPAVKDVSDVIAQGGDGTRHVLAARCSNREGSAGLLARLTLKMKTGEVMTVVTDNSWNSALSADEPRWSSIAFDDADWAAVKVVGNLGDRPWAQINARSLAAAEIQGSPQAPDPEGFKVAPGFRVERLYTVPKEEQGSWVNMTTDPKGRLIVSDQYGKLYRVTPPAIGATGEVAVEPIEVAIGEAQGLLWAFDSLYVVVNKGGKYASGLYRVRDTDGDDKFDQVEMLRELEGNSEHGPHAVVLSPDGKSLHVIAGNATQLTELSGSLVPRIWDEDQILPYMPDGNGFMANERAPGGCIYRVDPEGKDWVLVSMGYRNPFDLAFNRFGDLFTYDSDMEWDVNTPWYRPTRICQADSGSDLGYRNGSGKWPTYYPDSLPPVVNIGPGSPTGVTFGYGAAFPAKYEEALYACDWSYGKLYAVHLTPEQSHYKAEIEEFVTGTPLPLTDVVINPIDKAMYFTIGGRRTLSGLYRVTYVGKESTPLGGDPGAEARALRHSLEAFHGHADPEAVDAAWPHLGHPDRFIRYAARVAIEFQDPSQWQDKALQVKEPQASLTALLALARTGDHSRQRPLLEALSRLPWNELDLAQKLSALRVLELALIRMGEPEADLKAGMVAHLGSFYPARERELNTELCKILVSLDAPGVAAKTMALLAKAPTQEEQIEYATDLRLLNRGWTPELREAYFSWFPRAANFRGGASLAGFIQGIKKDAMAGLSDEEKAALRPILDARPDPKATASVAAPRPFVKAWTVEDLAPEAEAGLTKRDFDRGRELFAAASCFSCHRYDNEGGSVGPDLTSVAGRFGPRDLLESIVMPSKTVSDQYAAITVATSDGQVVTGRIVNLNGDNLMINTDMLDPNMMVNVKRSQVEEIRPSMVSMMPEGLLNTLSRDEIFDMMAYLLSRGDRTSPMFR